MAHAPTPAAAPDADMATHAAHQLARVHEQAETMFQALTTLRIDDAKTRGRDSDVYYGQCATLKALGLIDAARVDALEQAVRAQLYDSTGD